MNGYHIRKASLAHIAPLLADVRQEDVAEWVEAAKRMSLIAHGEVPRLWLRTVLTECVRAGMAESASAYDAYSLTNDDESEVLCIWGVGPHPKHRRTGIAWLIGTNEGQRKANRVQRLFREGIQSLHDGYPTLEAHVWAANSVHIYWLHRMGFRDVGPSDITPGEAFRCMVRTA